MLLDDQTLLLPILVAFRQLAISKATGYRLIKSRRLGPVIKIGRRSLIRQSDVEAYISSLLAPERRCSGKYQIFVPNRVLPDDSS